MVPEPIASELWSLGPSVSTGAQQGPLGSRVTCLSPGQPNVDLPESRGAIPAHEPESISSHWVGVTEPEHAILRLGRAAARRRHVRYEHSIGGIVFGLMFLVGAWWLTRRGLAPVIYTGVLCLAELLLVLFVLRAPPMPLTRPPRRAISSDSPPSRCLRRSVVVAAAGAAGIEYRALAS